MFDLVAGLPVHALVVHAVVVLLPLAALGTIAIAVRPAWRLSHGPLVAATALVSTVLVPVAASSGESLGQRVGLPEEHAALGSTLIWFALVLLAAVVALVVLERRRARSAGGNGPGWVRHALAVLAGVAAVAALVQVVLVGHSGAEAAWGYLADQAG